MPTPDDRIEDFINHWESAFGVRLTREEAVPRAHELVELFRVLGESKRQQDVDGWGPRAENENR